MDIQLYFFPVMEWSTDAKHGYDDWQKSCQRLSVLSLTPW